LFTEQRISFRVLHLVAYCICFLAILSTGSRGSAVFSLFIVGAGVVVRLRSFQDGLRYSLLFISVILVLVAVVMTSEYARNQLDFMLERFAFVSRGAVDMSIVERHERRLFYYRTMDSWILKGMQGYDFDYPHNIFFECVLRFGLVGCALIAAVIYSSLRAGVNLRSSLSSPFVWVISSVGFFTLLVVQVNLMLEHARWLWLFVGYWGVKESQRLFVGRMDHFFHGADDDHGEGVASFSDLGRVPPLEEA
jgi:O-antigen ligase